MQIDKIIGIVRSLREDMGVGGGMPTNNISGGKIAGSAAAGDDPPVRKKKRYIYQKGLRKTWSPTDGRKSS